jgi:hypothetical protein
MGIRGVCGLYTVYIKENVMVMEIKEILRQLEIKWLRRIRFCLRYSRIKIFQWLSWKYDETFCCAETNTESCGSVGNTGGDVVA